MRYNRAFYNAQLDVLVKYRTETGAFVVMGDNHKKVKFSVVEEICSGNIPAGWTKAPVI